MAIREQRFATMAEAEQALLALSIETLSQNLKKYPDVSLLLSGGRTPLPYYELLAKAKLPWQRIHLALVDERWVDSSNPASNETCIRQAFRDNDIALRNFTTMKTPASRASVAVAECNMRYMSLPWPPALGILGMGSDGHTASLFPHADGLEQALNSTAFCAAIAASESAVTGKYTERMTLTLMALLQCEQLVLFITGEDKWHVYQQARLRETLELPVSYVLARAQKVDVFWCNS